MYEALGLAWIPPELREHRGEIEAADEGPLPALISARDLRGDLHMHTTATDGKDDLEAMVRGGARRPASNTSPSPITARRWRWPTAWTKRARSNTRRAFASSMPASTAFACSPGSNATSCPTVRWTSRTTASPQLDLVIASVHSAIRQDEAEITARVMRAIEHPCSGHHRASDQPHSAAPRTLAPQSRARRRGRRRHGVALEINCQIDRLDLSDTNARLARERGVPLVISSDAHSRAELAAKRWGVLVARRAWARQGDVLNTLPFDEFRQRLRRNRRKGV